MHDKDVIFKKTHIFFYQAASRAKGETKGGNRVPRREPINPCIVAYFSPSTPGLMNGIFEEQLICAERETICAWL